MPAAMPAPDVTGTIPRTDPLVVAPALKAGLDALAGNDIATALATRNGLAEGSLDRHILTWAIATSGAPGVPSGEIAAAQTELKGWPGLKGLRANSERALYRENPPAPTVLRPSARPGRKPPRARSSSPARSSPPAKRSRLPGRFGRSGCPNRSTSQPKTESSLNSLRFSPPPTTRRGWTS
jgi:hypothetical protein